MKWNSLSISLLLISSAELRPDGVNLSLSHPQAATRNIASPKCTNTIYRALLLLLMLSLLLMSCNGNGGGQSSSTAAGRKLFVVNSVGDKISVFDLEEILKLFSPDGTTVLDIPPVRTIGSDARLSQPRGVFVDSITKEIFVTNSRNNTITVYKNTDGGDFILDRTLGGLNTGLFGPIALFVDPESQKLFVANVFGSITVYGRTDQGNIFPEQTIMGPELFSPMGIFVDAANDEILVTSFDFFARVGTILVYPKSADGLVSPDRVITIPELTDEGFPFIPTSLYMDDDELFVVDFGIPISGAGSPIIPFVDIAAFPVQQTFDSTIKVFKRMADGSFAPSRTIRGPNTGLLNPSGIYVDKVNGEVFVSNSFNNTVTVYTREDVDQGGDISPIRTLSIPDLNSAGILGERGMSSGIFVDHDTDQLFVANLNNTVTIHRRTAEGDEEPAKVIGSHTGLLDPQWIYVDTGNNEILTTNISSRQITVHATTDDGNIPPLRTIPQGLLVPKGISVDEMRDEIFVANSLLVDAITVYRYDDGAPLRSITGLSTGLFAPEGVFVDQGHGEVFVANPDDHTITVYKSEDEGDMTPLRTIVGENTGLSFPQGIFVDTADDQIFVTNPGNNLITIFPNDRTQTGNLDIPPSSVIGGAGSKISNPQGIFVDGRENKEVFVANSGDPSTPEDDTISIYRMTTGGDFALLGAIGGVNTGLDAPVGIFVADSP